MLESEELRPAPIRDPSQRFRCVTCGYGESCRMAPQRCPECGGSVWTYEYLRIEAAPVPSRSTEPDDPASA